MKQFKVDPTVVDAVTGHSALSLSVFKGRYEVVVPLTLDSQSTDAMSMGILHVLADVESNQRTKAMLYCMMSTIVGNRIPRTNISLSFSDDDSLII